MPLEIAVSEVQMAGAWKWERVPLEIFCSSIPVDWTHIERDF